MKFKTDFITNSSSTSFVVWGTILSEDEIKEKIGDKLFEFAKKDKYFEEHTKEEFFNDDQFRDFFMEYVDNVNNNLSCHTRYYSDEYSIGQCVSNMKDDQTLSELKEQTSKELLDIGFLVLPEKLSYIEICETDG